jgi:cation:H+ antiporter
MDAKTLFLFILGLGFLIAGAEALVRGASRLAAALGISPLVIGLTVVAYGTSAPELGVSVFAALRGQADIALGNVVGSNILNVLFILGISAAIVPLSVARQLVRTDVPLMIAVSLWLLIFAWDGAIARLEALLLTAGAVAYTWFSVWESRRESKAALKEFEQHYAAPPPQTRGQLAMQASLMVAGLALLGVGSKWLVEGAVALARTFGLSELVIGLTIVAAGTSLPEVATSVVAAIRGERDIAVGNVVGSNLYNILCILGVAGLVAPQGIAVSSAAFRFDIPVMIAVAVACLPIFFTGYRIARWEGYVLLGYYVAYVAYLLLSVRRDDPTLPVFSAAMLWFVLPLTAYGLLHALVRALRGTNRQAPAP